MLLTSHHDFPIVTIVTPFYNAELYLRETIESVLNQTYQHWELILINDGSVDSSKSIAMEYSDKRIVYLEQENKGVVSARNAGLAAMSGDFFCFLDADDVFPSNSLKVRIDQFRSNPKLSFTDGQVVVMDAQLKATVRKWTPDFKGNPLKDLVSLSGKSFFGITWMVKRHRDKIYRMKEGLSHSEDLLFFIELSREGGLYGYTDETILLYRNTPNSAMKNLAGLEDGYRFVHRVISEWTELDAFSLNAFRNRVKQIMFRSYLRKGRLRKAWGSLHSWV